MQQHLSCQTFSLDLLPSAAESAALMAYVELNYQIEGFAIAGLNTDHQIILKSINNAKACESYNKVFSMAAADTSLFSDPAVNCYI